jgi:hypothetical protein
LHSTELEWQQQTLPLAAAELMIELKPFWLAEEELARNLHVNRPN